MLPFNWIFSLLNRNLRKRHEDQSLGGRTLPSKILRMDLAGVSRIITGIWYLARAAMHFANKIVC